METMPLSESIIKNVEEGDESAIQVTSHNLHYVNRIMLFIDFIVSFLLILTLSHLLCF